MKASEARDLGRSIAALAQRARDEEADWLVEQLLRFQRRPRAWMLRKAMTYLPSDQRARSQAPRKL